MFIAIDIGNTHTVIGIYKKDTLIANCRLTSTTNGQRMKYLHNIHSLLIEVGTNKKKIDGIGISSVVPNLTKIYSAMAKKYFHQEPMIVSSRIESRNQNSL